MRHDTEEYNIQSLRKLVWGPQIPRWGPPIKNIHFMSTRRYPFTTSFPYTPFQLQKHKIANWIGTPIQPQIP